MSEGAKMQTLLTQEQARVITNGRKPLVPVVYEQAITALAECLSIDDAKLWHDKADALAAWAKIYHSNEVARQARALKLHACRRMGELAFELNPARRKAGAGMHGKSGYMHPGSQKTLLQAGVKHGQATACSNLARLSKEQFEHLANLPRPPAPTTVALMTSTSVYTAAFAGPLANFGGLCRKHKPSAIAASVHPMQHKVLIDRIRAIIDWLEDCEASLLEASEVAK
jgi:hypothetical protein